MPEYIVEVQRTTAERVRVSASGPEDAVRLAGERALADDPDQEAVVALDCEVVAELDEG